ncbi:tRNA (adenosine(37)-N6)-threonylcarbamoyltransferase complex transferase subunit TsaD, partial [Streptomyces alfalfae]
GGRRSVSERLAGWGRGRAGGAGRGHGGRRRGAVGGAGPNARVRSLAEGRCRVAGVTLRVPPPRLCTDNGAMIAAVGDLLVRAGAEPAPLDVSIDPSAPLEFAALCPVGGSGRARAA